MNRSASAERQIVVVFTGYYLPGFRAGGLVRALVNTVDHLSEEFDFRIVAGDRDVGDDRPYPGVRIDAWNEVGNARVYYVGEKSRSMVRLAELANEFPGAPVYLNSFFDPLTVKLVAAARLGRVGRRRLIVSPRGEFSWASLKQKYPKKLAFMWLARLAGLYGHVHWHAASEVEAKEIVEAMHVPRRQIHVALDFPPQIPIASAELGVPPADMNREDSALRVIFLSRIAREKNLDLAIRVLQRVKSKVVFDIYGPIADAQYWAECQRLIADLPPNVVARYRGIVAADDVMRVFAQYDLFLLPTGGEGYGHVIVESLLAGTPVLISRETLWRDLASAALGWDVDLGDLDIFVARIEELARTPAEERHRRRPQVRDTIVERLADPTILKSNRELLVGTA